MKKVLQTIVDKGNGNCLQAAAASLFEKDLEEVPHFIQYGIDWWDKLDTFFMEHGYDGIMILNPQGVPEQQLSMAMEHDGGVNGYWIASVPSQTFDVGTHAVIIDKDLNIVHDPNPNQKAVALGKEDIIDIYTVKQDWHLHSDGEVLKIYGRA